MTDVEKLLKQLHRHAVKYFLIGGMAAVAQGSSYLTAEGLIVSKKATGRPKDLKWVPELEALLEIRKSQES